jgi:selenium metabolism protein YedF
VVKDKREEDLVDCRGLACPEPVLRTKQALEGAEEGVVTVLVDNPASRENVRRFAESQGGTVSVTDAAGGGWQVTIAKGYSCAAPAEAESTSTEGSALGTVLMVTSDRIGPEPELGTILMRTFLSTLPKGGQKPSKALFLNRGVHLTTDGSEVLGVLEELERSGTEILSCGTCLEFFGKRESLRVGRVSNMYETVETLLGPCRLVSIS